MSTGSIVPLILVATADREGVPHLSTAQELHLAPHDRIEVEAWFCPQTLRNLQGNPAVSMVVWDRHNDRGVQIRGRTERVEASAALDGYVPGVEAADVPQVLQRLFVLMERVSEFRDRAHSDAAAVGCRELSEMVAGRP